MEDAAEALKLRRRAAACVLSMPSSGRHSQLGSIPQMLEQWSRLLQAAKRLDPEARTGGPSSLTCPKSNLRPK